MPIMNTHNRPLQNQLGFWVHRLTAAIRADHTTQLAHLDLGVNEAWALCLLHEGAAGRPAELAKGLGIDASLVTRMLRRLVGRGLVVRIRPDDDLRAVRLELTEAGKRLAGIAKRTLMRTESQLTEDLTSAEVHALVSQLAARLERTGWDLEDV